MTAQGERRPLFDPPMVRQALIEALKKLHPWHQVRNPVMCVVLVGSVLTTGLLLQALVGHGEAPAGFILAVSLWLWFTVLFANLAEAMAEGHGTAQAAALRRTWCDVMAKKLARPQYGTRARHPARGWPLLRHARSLWGARAGWGARYFRAEDSWH
jgi:potassium-transporting ATPase ATP-binding subunit